jgi:hypothetical protein
MFTVKVKVKFNIERTTKAQRALDGEGDQRHALAASPPGKTRYPFYRRLSDLRGQTGRVGKILPLMRFDPWTVHPVASRYTD